MGKSPLKTSSAMTRWRVLPSPSRAAGRRTPGYITFDVELLRNRYGGVGRWQMEWNSYGKNFAKPTLSGALLSPSVNRQIYNGQAA